MYTEERLIHDWEYQKNLRKMYSDDEEMVSRCIYLCSLIYARAVKEFGYSWAETHLKKD